jgi:hypothetical protein
MVGVVVGVGVLVGVGVIVAVGVVLGATGVDIGVSTLPPPHADRAKNERRRKVILILFPIYTPFTSRYKFLIFIIKNIYIPKLIICEP